MRGQDIVPGALLTQFDAGAVSIARAAQAARLRAAGRLHGDIKQTLLEGGRGGE